MKELSEALNKLSEILAPFDGEASSYIRKVKRKSPQDIANDLSIWGDSGSLMDQGIYGQSSHIQRLFGEAAKNLGSILMNAGYKNPNVERWVNYFEKWLNENDNSISLKWTQEKLQNMTALDAKALKEKFGVNLENSTNLEEVGRQFDVTRERIRKIEEKALRKLRNRGGDDDPDAA